MISRRFFGRLMGGGMTASEGDSRQTAAEIDAIREALQLVYIAILPRREMFKRPMSFWIRVMSSGATAIQEEEAVATAQLIHHAQTFMRVFEETRGGRP